MTHLLPYNTDRAIPANLWLECRPVFFRLHYLSGLI